MEAVGDVDASARKSSFCASPTWKVQDKAAWLLILNPARGIPNLDFPGPPFITLTVRVFCLF
jgi:hypothetical protein